MRTFTTERDDRRTVHDGPQTVREGWIDCPVKKRSGRFAWLQSEPLFDVVPLGLVDLTAQLVTNKGSQIACVINEKLCIGDIVFLGEAMEKRCRRSVPRRL